MKKFIAIFTLLLFLPKLALANFEFISGDFKCSIESPYDEYAEIIYAMKSNDGVIDVPSQVEYNGKTFKVGSFYNFAFVYLRDENGKVIENEPIREINLPATICSLNLNGTIIQLSSECERITVAAENEYFCDIDGVLFTKDLGMLIVYPYSKRDEKLELPSSTKIIYDCAVNSKYLTKITLNDGLEEIRYGGLATQGLTSIRIPKSVKKMEGFFVGGSVKEMYVCWEDPIYMDPNGYYPEVLYTQSTLYVPEGCREKYQKAPYWNRYWNIEEYDVASVKETVIKEGIDMIFDLNGNPISNINKAGIYILKYNNGKIKKVFFNPE